MAIDGVYLGYMTGSSGTTLGIFHIANGILAGGDVGGGVYDGEYRLEDNCAVGEIVFRAPNGGQLVSGGQSDFEIKLKSTFAFATPIEMEPYHTVQSSVGTINIRFEKVRDL